MSNLVLYEVNDRVGYITLNRPEKRNALSFELVQQLKDALVVAERDENCKVIVLKANGDAFCAGADLAYLQQLQSNTFEENLADSQHLMQLFQLIYHCKKIVIAQVQGAALAGGSGLATVCDFCFATPESTFGYTEVKIGFVPAIVMVFLVRKVTEQRAKQLLLTGEVFAADKALEYGLINKVVSSEELAETVNAFAQQLCVQTSAQSVGMVKEMLAEVQQLSLEEGLHYAANMNANARATADCQKGIAAFLNKEKIKW
ncbi:MAG: enoyl-CoA hydratase/isomerase family protein [Bacteroidia bacterium]|jgi:methylglutaconyl-CoA hydratase|nr:enoyl-CoA hydratase/isomerase family protein [Bacteroidia bacterium]